MAVGVNKSSEQYVLADEKSPNDMASGTYRDQRRATYGKLAERSPASSTPDSGALVAASRARPRRQPAGPRPRKPAWTPAQQSLAMIYNARGMRPDEIAGKMGVSSYLVTQMVLAAKSRGR